MNDTSKNDTDRPSRRPRIGNIIMWIGIASLITGILSTSAISYLAATGTILTTPNYQILNTIALAGIILIVLGFLIRFGVSNFSKDGLWSLKTGPYVK